MEEGTAGMTLAANHSSPQDMVDCKKKAMSYEGRYSVLHILPQHDGRGF